MTLSMPRLSCSPHRPQLPRLPHLPGTVHGAGSLAILSSSGYFGACCALVPAIDRKRTPSAKLPTPRSRDLSRCMISPPRKVTAITLGRGSEHRFRPLPYSAAQGLSNDFCPLRHFPALAVPGDHVLEQLDHAGRIGREQVLALLGGRLLGPADVSSHRAVLRGPAAIGRLEPESEADRLGPLVIPHQMRGEPQHHRRLPLAGVAHL